MNKVVGIYTLGCKVNSYESEYIIEELKKNNFIIGNFNDKCDIYIINTCTVTNQADSKSKKIIREAISRNPNACIIAMGCYVESHKFDPVPGINILIGNSGKSKIVKLINEYYNNYNNKNDINDIIPDEFEDMYISNFNNRSRAFVKVQDGCENYCTYCIIPYVRGKCRSKELNKVVSEVKDLVNNGYKEVVLTGIHTGSYGKDLNLDFSDLLLELVKIPNYRLRISSIEVTELNDKVLDIIKNNNCICNHLHIPLQAGSNEILKLMNRKYDLDFYINKIKEIRKIRNDIAISTDVIVGFPGETEELFNKTIETCKEIGFSKIHVFPYSVRKNTPAEKFPKQLDNLEKKKRSKKLIEVSKELEINYMNKFLNKEVDVLIENSVDQYSYGHTSNYLYVKLNGNYVKEEEITCKIIDVSYPYVLGEVIRKD